ncbi:unconventional myosin-XVIIIb [Scleropages formosus]|uniref:unconventional myosin-XVIIIb n=1 Tax=Scleropages formosus TaxID=113540 RepID=UPI0010FAA9A9|nr:unconventional myosin-XVIIIb [Scleropages formosus]XP_029108766.1 unconventional myosin-XVIIIb [Scleropages formosus]XP_029108767.1 unconventional myosin-XVIIIb [Scleropages formosus]
MALSSRLKLWEQKIQEEKKPSSVPAPPPPPLSAVPGGFLKQLVRETEKETRLKEPEIKEEKVPSKLSDSLVQQFLLPDETPPILEAEMALRAEQLVNGERDKKVLSGTASSSPGAGAQRGEERPPPDASAARETQVPGEEDGRREKVRGQADEGERKRGETLEAEGRFPHADVPQQEAVAPDIWYEAGTVWYTRKEGFARATQLKPDEGTPELPAGKVRVRLETDGSLHDVMEYEIEEVNPPELDLVEDLSELVSMNESGVLHTLCSRARAQLPLTRAGPNLLALWPPPASPSKGSRSPRGEGAWEAPSVLQALVRRTYVAMVSQRRDQSVLALGRSGTGKTSVCTTFAQELLRHAGAAGNCLTPERLQAVFAVLRSFGCVSSPHSDASSRFAMLLSLDFNHAGLVAGGHLQTMLLEKWKVCQKMEGESNFLVFSQMLAGLSVEMRTQLHLHQQSEPNSFGIVPLAKVDERQKASAAFAKLLSAMETLGFSANEQQAIWHVLAGIYHLGAAGSCKVGRRQFLSFDNAQLASSVLGCEGEELQTAVFKHHLRQLLLKATGGSRERHASEGPEEGGPRLSAKQCVEGMAMGLYEELFAAVVSLINRSLCSHQLTLASVTVVDAPGLRSPRHCGAERAAGFAELAHNYLQERLLEHCYTHTFTRTLERYAQEKVPVDFRAPESSAAPVVSAIDQPVLQLRAAEGDARGLLWVLDEETMTPGSTESAVLDRVCRYFGDTVRQCEQPLQCEIAHQLGSDLIRYDLSGWISLVQNNPSALNAAALLQNSTIGAVKSLFGPRASLPPLCRGIGGVEGGSQRSLQRSGIVRKTFSGGLAAVRRQSYCISVKLQADALVNLIRRTGPVFLQCIDAKTTDGGKFDVPSVRAQLSSTHLLSALQLYRTGYPDHMSLSDFRCRFQALSPPVMKRYGSVFITPDDRKAVEELLVDLDLDKKSIVVGTSRVFMKRGVLRFLEQERDRLVSGWMVLLQASCLGHLARQKYRCMKVQHMAVSCIQRNVRVLSAASTWSWWKLFCRVRPMLNVNIDDQRFRAKEDEIAALRQRLEKSEKDRNELRQTVDHLETKVTALSSELCDERFRGEAVSQALDVERAERLRLAKESKELLSRLEQCKTTMDGLEKQLEEEKQQAKSREMLGGMGTKSELQLQLECAQTEVEFLRRRLRQSEERLDQEREARAQLDSKVLELHSQLEQSKRTVTELKRQCRRLTSDLQDARVLTDNLQSRAHELDRKQRRFDSELTQALEGADGEREQKEKFIQENAALRAEILRLQQGLKESQAETSRLQQQKEELRAQVKDLSGPTGLAADSLPGLKKQLRELEELEKERSREVSQLSAKIQQHEQMHLRCEMEMERMKQIHQKELEDKDEELEDVQKSSQRRLRQLEMQLEQEYEEKQRVVHEKHDLEGLIATLCEQVGHRDFDVEKRLRRDLKRTRALLSDAQLLLSTADTAGQGQGGTHEQLERLHTQLEESEARRVEAENVKKMLAMELENAQLELESICKHKSLVDEQLAQLLHEKMDLLKRLEEDQEDLNELMKKHKALIAQSSSDISQIQELQTELEEAKKEKQRLEDELLQCVARLQHLESSTVSRSIVSKQEARVCDLENKLEFQRGQIKRFEVLVLRLRDSVVRLGEELEQAAQAEARERENARYYQQRLADLRLEMEDLIQQEQESGRRRLELEMQVEELSAVRQTLQADLDTSMRRIADLQAALEEMDSGGESDGESVQTAVQFRTTKRELDGVSSVGSLLSEDSGEGIRTWLGVPRGQTSSPYGGSSTTGSVGGRQSVTDTLSTCSFRSLPPEQEKDNAEATVGGQASSSSALSELLKGLRRKRTGWQQGAEQEEASAVSLPIYQTTGAATLRRRSSALSLAEDDGPEEPRTGILKRPSPALPRASSLRSLPETGSVGGTCGTSAGSGRLGRFGSCDSLTSMSSGQGPRQRPHNPIIPEEEEVVQQHAQATPTSPSPQPLRRRLLGGLEAEAEELPLGAEPLVFQNRHLSSNLENEKHYVGEWQGDSADACSDILPAIRRAQSTSSLAGSVKAGSRRALSVHFGALPPSRAASRRGSDSDSSGSGGSQHQGERQEAEGSEGDINSVMRKYLNRPEAQ